MSAAERQRRHRSIARARPCSIPMVAGLLSLDELLAPHLVTVSDEELAALRALPGGDEPIDSPNSDED